MSNSISARRRKLAVRPSQALLLLGVAIVLNVIAGCHVAPPPAPTVTVAYRGESRLLHDSRIEIHETVTFDSETLASLARWSEFYRSSKPRTFAEGAAIYMPGWKAATLIDGYLSFERTRVDGVSDTSMVSTTLTVPLRLGVMVTEGLPYMEVKPRAGSSFEVTAQRGSVGTTFPAPARLDQTVSSERTDVLVFAVDPHLDDISVVILTPMLRNPPGKAAYDAIQWGPFPVAVGLLVVFISGILTEKAMDGANAMAVRFYRRVRRLRQGA